MNKVLFRALFFFFGVFVVIFEFAPFIHASTNGNENDESGLRQVKKGKWVVTFNPAVAAVREHLLTEMSGGGGTTIRVMARFIANDGSQVGTFHHDVAQSIGSHSSCASSPDPEFWRRYGEKLIMPNSVRVEANQLSFTLKKLRAADGSLVLPGGRMQTITCGPIARKGEDPLSSPPTSTGFFLDPPSFSFNIEPGLGSSLVFLRHPDMFPFASVTYGSRGGPQAQKRADFDHIELYANPKLGADGLDFYVAASANEFLIDTDEQQKHLKEEISRKFVCQPAPCHLRLRNRTFNFVDFKAAEAFAKKNGYHHNGADPMKTAMKSWFDGSSEDHQVLDGGSPSSTPRIIRPQDITIINSGLVRVKVTSGDLFRRGFDLPPLDDVQQTKAKGLPSKPSIYKLQLRHLAKDTLRVPHTLDDTRPLDRLVYLTLEAPYAPAQNIHLTYVDERRSAWPLFRKKGGPLVITDRCIAAGVQFHADEEAVRGKVMPGFVHRCPSSIILHADMVVGTHPLGVKVEHLFVPGRCHGQNLECARLFFEELPPLSNEWAKNRLVEDVPGFAVTSSSSSDSTDDAAEHQQLQQEVAFPELVAGDEARQEFFRGGGVASNNSVTSSFAYPLASTNRVVVPDDDESRRRYHSSFSSSEKPQQKLISSEDWIEEFDFFSKGALRIKLKPRPNFRVHETTLLSLGLHPGLIRNGRPPDSTENPMTIVVVPSHGIVSVNLVVDAGTSNNNNNNNNNQNEVLITSEHKISVSVIWRMDEYDVFSSKLIEALNQQIGKDLVAASSSSSASSFSPLPATWTLFAPSPSDGNISASSSSSQSLNDNNENTVCSDWRVRPGVAESVVVRQPATEKEVHLLLTFSLPPSATSSSASPTPVESSCPNIELSAPGFDTRWVESGKTPLSQNIRINLFNPV